MKSRDFAYWLQRFIETNNDAGANKQPHPSPEQRDTIKRHLALVFKHDIDPEAGRAAVQQILNQIHQSPSKPINLGGVDPTHPNITYRR